MRVIFKQFNTQEVINMVAVYGSTVTLGKRWQLILQDKSGQLHVNFFVAKPTRKQIRALMKKTMVYVPFNKRCYECGERIRLADYICLDNQNYAHTACLRGAK